MYQKKDTRRIGQKAGMFDQVLEHHRGIVLGFMIILGGILITRTILSQTLFSRSNTITTVAFSATNTTTLNDPALYQTISKRLSNMNYYKLVYRKQRTILRNLTSQFPFIEDRQLSRAKNNQLVVTLKFKAPPVILVQSGGQTAARENVLYPLPADSTLGSLGSGSLIVQLPDYVQSKLLTGIFFDIPLNKLLRDRTIAKKALPEITTILYLAGGGKTILKTSDNKNITIDHTKNTEEQIKKTLMLKYNYPAYPALHQIDAGSLEYLIVRQ